MAVIGLDFGNFNSYTSFIQDLDYNAGRLGGRAAELMPAGEFRDGIPSVFYYKPGDAKPLVCQTEGISMVPRVLGSKSEALKSGSDRAEG